MSEKANQNEVLKFDFSEPQPILREAKVVQIESKSKSKREKAESGVCRAERFRQTNPTASYLLPLTWL
ncbi:MAG: hypothetical protein PUE90_03950 [Bacteroidales bacterium]|nr:hypothetical protein [Bacteroidales bacterium]